MFVVNFDENYNDVPLFATIDDFFYFSSKVELKDRRRHPFRQRAAGLVRPTTAAAAGVFCLMIDALLQAVETRRFGYGAIRPNDVGGGGCFF